MATKLIKKPTKRHHHNRHYHRLNRKNRTEPEVRCVPLPAAVTAGASIVATMRTYRRRILRFVSVLTRRHHRHRRASTVVKGLKVLKNNQSDSKNVLFRPRLVKNEKERKTIVLDLDETMIHSTMHHPPSPGTVKYDFVVRPKIEGEAMTFFVTKRPGLDEFLEKIREKFEVVVFTAGIREYASLVLDRLDPGRRVISHALYRDACREGKGGYLVKDLRLVAADLRRVVIVDDNPNSYELQRENAIPIKPFIDDLKDNELKKLGNFFDRCDDAEDMRVAVKAFLAQN